MTDLSDESLPPWTDEELAVLRSADHDRPGSRSLAATLTAVGAGGAVASTVITAKGAAVTGKLVSAGTAKWAAALTVAKWLSVVAFGGTVVTGSVVLLRHAERPVAPAQTGGVHARVSSVERPALAAPSTSDEPGLEVFPAVTEDAPSDVPEVAAPSLPGRKAATRAQPDISLEIAALDEARTALRSGRPADALRALDRYDATFAKGSLRVEATALRIDALLRSGRRDSAQSLADAFLARNPKSPYAARIRTLMSGSSTGR